MSRYERQNSSTDWASSTILNGLENLNCQPLYTGRARGDMIEVYKHIHTNDPAILSRHFQLQAEAEKTTFNLFGICQKDCTRGLQANSFYYRTTRIWNELPKKVVNAKNINEFKSLHDEVWKDKATIYPATTTSDS